MNEQEQREPSEDEPFVLAEEGNTAIVRFAEYVDHPRAAWEDGLVRLIRSRATIVWDLTRTVMVESGWLRLLARLHDDGKEQGKQVLTVGMSDTLLNSADYLGLKGSFEHRPNLADVAVRPAP